MSDLPKLYHELAEWWPLMSAPETFVPSTDHGGHDGDGRALRYIEGAWDPDPSDTTYLVDYAYLLHSGADLSVIQDRHVEGLFSASTWLDTFRSVGFDAQPRPYRHTDVDRLIDVFLARRPA